MTKEELIDMARKSGWEYADDESGFESLWAFAKLVAEKEREACAKVADNRLLLDASSKERNIYDLARKNIAADIRARGEA